MRTIHSGERSVCVMAVKILVFSSIGPSPTRTRVRYSWAQVVLDTPFRALQSGAIMWSGWDRVNNVTGRSRPLRTSSPQRSV